ncbi:hypothetical protein [Nitratifractor sp.]
MNAAIGFKGRYWRLAAITALNAQIRERAEGSRVEQCRKIAPRDPEERESDDPPELLALSELYTAVTTRFSRKPCHCNCLFKRKFKRLFHLYKFIVRPPRRYVKTKTGTSPPNRFALSM